MKDDERASGWLGLRLIHFSFSPASCLHDMKHCSNPLCPHTLVQYILYFSRGITENSFQTHTMRSPPRSNPHVKIFNTTNACASASAIATHTIKQIIFYSNSTYNQQRHGQDWLAIFGAVLFYSWSLVLLSVDSLIYLFVYSLVH